MFYPIPRLTKLSNILGAVRYGTIEIFISTEWHVNMKKSWTSRTNADIVQCTVHDIYSAFCSICYRLIAECTSIDIKICQYSTHYRPVSNTHTQILMSHYSNFNVFFSIKYLRFQVVFCHISEHGGDDTASRLTTWLFRACKATQNS